MIETICEFLFKDSSIYKEKIENFFEYILKYEEKEENKEYISKKKKKIKIRKILELI